MEKFQHEQIEKLDIDELFSLAAQAFESSDKERLDLLVDEICKKNSEYDYGLVVKIIEEQLDKFSQKYEELKTRYVDFGFDTPAILFTEEIETMLKPLIIKANQKLEELDSWRIKCGDYQTNDKILLLKDELAELHNLMHAECTKERKPGKIDLKLFHLTGELIGYIAAILENFEELMEISHKYNEFVKAIDITAKSLSLPAEGINGDPKKHIVALKEKTEEIRKGVLKDLGILTGYIN